LTTTYSEPAFIYERNPLSAGNIRRIVSLRVV